MAEDPRRLEGGKFFLDIAKYVLTGVAVSSLITERINVKIGLWGIMVGVLLAIVGFLTLPPKKWKPDQETET